MSNVEFPPNWFDANYYQHGLETGKSNYQNYRWIPELTIPLAMTIIDYLEIKRHHFILDLGCALGYLVKAFRLLHRQAWGADVSDYALTNTDLSIRNYCFNSNSSEILKRRFDFCVAKDIFEHLSISTLKETIHLLEYTKTIFAVIPLGKDGQYIAPTNNMDKSHVICEDMNWWRKTFSDLGLTVEEYRYQINGIKDAYYKDYPEAHGFFVLTR